MVYEAFILLVEKKAKNNLIPPKCILLDEDMKDQIPQMLKLVNEDDSPFAKLRLVDWTEGGEE